MAQDGANIVVPLVNLYGFAVDTQRWDLFDQIFTKTPEIDYGGGAEGGGAKWSSLTKLKEDFAAFHAPFDAYTTYHVEFCLAV